MDTKRIKDLLEKYYNGEASLSDEIALRDYFSKGDISNEFIADKDIFLCAIREKENEARIPDISDEIWSNVQNAEISKENKGAKLSYFYLRIAAGIVILVSTFFFVKNQVFDKKYDLRFTDTYSDPEQAYQEAREALLYVSAMLNKGTGHMEPMHKMNEGTQQLHKLASFNDGLMELRPMNAYNVTNKYFKQ